MSAFLNTYISVHFASKTQQHCQNKFHLHIQYKCFLFNVALLIWKTDHTTNYFIIYRINYQRQKYKTKAFHEKKKPWDNVTRIM